MTFDVANSSSIRHLSTFQPDVDSPRKNPGLIQHPNACGLAIRGRLLFVANDAGGLRVLDMKDRTQPREIGRYINAAMARKQQAYNNIVIQGDRAYIAIDYAGLEIVDISNHRNIRQLGWWNPWDAHTLKNLWFNSPGHTNQLKLDASRNVTIDIMERCCARVDPMIICSGVANNELFVAYRFSMEYGAR